MRQVVEFEVALADNVGSLDRVLQRLRGDLVETGGLNQRLARGLDVQAWYTS